MATTHIEALIERRLNKWPDSESLPFKQIGVFPTNDQSEIEADYSWFNYTVGLGAFELHLPCYSIEHRGLGNQLAAEILNSIAVGILEEMVIPGDTVIVPLGIPNLEGTWEYDANAYFWLHNTFENSRTLGVNMTPCLHALPIRWSSPLGWQK